MPHKPDDHSATPDGGGIAPVASLGEPIRVFRAKLVTRAVVAVCGAIMVLGGIFLLVGNYGWYIQTFPLVLGICVLGLAYVMGKSSYLICPDGVIRVRMGYQQQCRWDDVREIIDRHIKRGLVSSRLCELVKKNGFRLELTDLGTDDFPGMLGLIRQQAQSRGIPWREEQVIK